MPSFPLDERTIRRNVMLGAINQFSIEGAMTLSEASTVLPLFVRALGGSTFLAGLLPSLRWFGWMAPQFFVAGRLQRLERFVPTTVLLELVRCLLYLAIAGLTMALGVTSPATALSLFFVLFMITRVAAGSSAVARTEIIARIVPAERRASLISLRRLMGGVAGLLAGLMVRYVLDERVSTFPRNFGLLIGSSGVFFALATISLGLTVEPQVDAPRNPRDVRGQLAQLPTILGQDRAYVRYLVVRMLSSGLTLVSPFYILYATEVLGAPASMAGVFIAARTFSRIISNMAWGRACERQGSARVLAIACAIGIVAPALVLSLGLIQPHGWATEVPDLIIWIYGAAFLVEGLAVSGLGLGTTALLYDLAPEDERPTYFGLSNTLLGPIYFLPALGGALVDRFGYLPLFALATLTMFGATWMATRFGSRERAHVSEA